MANLITDAAGRPHRPQPVPKVWPSLNQWLFSAVAVCGLAAVLWPVLNPGRPSDGPPSCLSKLKQLGAGFMMYAHDYDGRLPPARQWRDALWPYTKNVHFWRCPSDARADRDVVGSYSFNAYLDGSLELDRLPDPASVTVLFDAEPLSRMAVSRGGDFAARHQGRGSILYADGHVKTQAAEFHLRLAPVKLLPASRNR